MNYLLAVYIPIILSVVWAAGSLFRKGRRTDVCVILFGGAIVVTNGLIRHFFFEGYQLPVAVNAVQQVLASLIVPTAYIFFSSQMGRSWWNGTSITLLSLIALLLCPNILIVGGGQYPTGQEALNLGFRSLCYVSRSGELYEFEISDFIIALQAVVTMIRLAPTFRKILRYGLELSSDVKRFLVWWAFAVLFIVFASLNSTPEEGAAMNIFCHLFFMALVTSIFVLLGRGFDLRPVLVTKENDVKTEEPVELDEFVQRSHEMAARLRAMIDEQKIYLESGYSKDRVITEFGTNRTYFAKMMKAEFGCSFSDLLNNKRVEEAKQLLVSTDDPLVDICQQSGFSDPSYMIKVFKHHTGYTPMEWKGRNKR